MRTVQGVEGLRALTPGEELGVSDWVEVSQERIDQFAEATGDHQWIHVDVEKAAEGPFGTTIAHGFLTLSLVPMLSWSVWTVEGITMGINYGSDKVRFLTPVPSGARVRGRFTFTKLEETGAGIRVYTTGTVELEGADKPALVVESISLFVP